jgi:hypothetical protein
VSDQPVLDLDAIRARADAATPGPWTVESLHRPQPGCRCLSCVEDEPWAYGLREVDGPESPERCIHPVHVAQADAEFIAHARIGVPALVAEVSRLRTELAEALMAASAEADLVDANSHAYDQMRQERELAALRAQVAEHEHHRWVDRHEALEAAAAGGAEAERRVQEQCREVEQRVIDAAREWAGPMRLLAAVTDSRAPITAQSAALLAAVDALPSTPREETT